MSRVKKKEGFALPLILILAVSISLLVGGVVSLTTGLTEQYNVYKYYASLKAAEMNAIHYGIWLLNKYGLSNKFTLLSSGDEEYSIFVNTTGETPEATANLWVFSIKDNDIPEVDKDETFKVLEDYPYIYIKTDTAGIPVKIYSVVNNFDYASADINQEMDNEGFISKIAYAAGNKGTGITEFESGVLRSIEMDLDSKFGSSEYGIEDFARYIHLLEELEFLGFNPPESPEDVEENIGRNSKGNILVRYLNSRGVKLSGDKALLRLTRKWWLLWPEFGRLDDSSLPDLSIEKAIYNGSKEGILYDFDVSIWDLFNPLISYSSTESSSIFFTGISASITSSEFISKLSTGDIEEINIIYPVIKIDNNGIEAGWDSTQIATVTEFGFFNYEATRVLNKILEDGTKFNRIFIINYSSTPSAVERVFMIKNGANGNEYDIKEYDLTESSIFPVEYSYKIVYQKNVDGTLDATFICTDCEPTPVIISSVKDEKYLTLYFPGRTVVGDIDKEFTVDIPLVIASSKTVYLSNDVKYSNYINNDDEESFETLNATSGDPSFILISGESIIALKKQISDDKLDNLNLMGSFYPLNGSMYWEPFIGFSSNAFVNLLTDIISGILDTIETVAQFLGLDINILTPFELSQYIRDINIYGQLLEEKSLNHADVIIRSDIEFRKNDLTNLLSIITGVDEDELVEAAETFAELVFDDLGTIITNKFINTRFERNIIYDDRLEDFVRSNKIYIPSIALPKTSVKIEGTYYTAVNMNW